MDFITQDNLWLLYLGLFIGPFVQEDTAVITAASLSITETAPWPFIYLSILAGLIASDSWKYWPGWAAARYERFAKYGQKPKVLSVKDKVTSNAAKTLIAVRFLPMARIPTYLACGFFNVKYIIYWLSIAFSAFLYVSMFFIAFNILGEVAGDHLKYWIPRIAIPLVVIFLAINYFKSRK